MPHGSILQLAHGEPDISTSAATYAAYVPQWGFPAVHTQLLQELKGWSTTVLALHRQPREALERVLEIEGSILMDASVAGLAAEHIPFLYTVLGDVFAEVEPAFRRTLHMDESGTEDRLEAIYALETVALQRLQERQEQVMLVVKGLGEDEITALSQ
jgi:hypothetical protein